MAVGRPSTNAGSALGKMKSFDLGAIGHGISSLWNNTVKPWVVNSALPAIAHSIDPSVGKLYDDVKEGIDRGEDWENVVGGAIDQVTGTILPKAVATIPVLGEFAKPLEQATNVVKRAKEFTGVSTSGVLKGLGGMFKRKAEDQPTGILSENERRRVRG